MSVVTKLHRCADCGSTEVRVENGIFICDKCGSHLDHGMPASDLEKLQKAAMMSGGEELLDDLRRRYRNLDITSWSSTHRVQN